MAEEKKTAVLDGEEYVEFEAFYDGINYKDDIVVTVNGQNCHIKRGEKVRIKRKFLEAIKNSEDQDRQTARMMENLSREFESESRKY